MNMDHSIQGIFFSNSYYFVLNVNRKKKRMMMVITMMIMLNIVLGLEKHRIVI